MSLSRLLLTLSFAFVSACGPTDHDRELLVLAASSLGPAFTEIKAEFEAGHLDAAVEINPAASSTLAAQIIAGAPADLFASADPESMDQVVAAGLIVDPQPFVRNRLTLVVPAANPGGVSGLRDLARPELLVGLCAEAVPCGSLAKRLLDSAGVVASIDTAEVNVRALATKLESGELDVGIVYLTDVTASEGRLIALPIPFEVETIYAIGFLEATPRRDLAGAFVGFVTSQRGIEILTTYGFEAP
jgi:molybdate transport system substrate-binding protein